MAKDYYNLLGISKNASEDEIKKAYRRMAHKHHPDKAGGDEKKFKEINEAYQILSDSKKRAQYDRFGKAFDGAGGFGGFDFSQGQNGFDFGFGFDPSQMEDMGNLGDIFDAFFEGLGVKRRKTYQRGADLELAKEITLEDAFRGASSAIKFETSAQCAGCGGAGHEPKEGFTKCATCEGKGEIRETHQSFFGQFSQVRQCGKCRGQGQIPNKICGQCGGSGRVKAQKEIQVRIAPGISDGQLIKISGAGQAGERGAGSGDLYVRVRVKPHAVFKRNGDDLTIKKDLNMIDVLLGRKIELPVISGNKIKAEIPAGFNLRNPLKIANEGMPKLGGYGRGDLYAEFDIKVPKIDSKIRKALGD
ncbi:MAG: hypothetical protein A3I89_01400 [Candidatus Harrisonbacteria bacterium RIFCSPLOWO2_02_FULL_41_11]|uniref:Chaperone protein DnaJ n=1 Tax=Candidatus Harrisonbacteria bacterium RIFCSPHIGHO2_02_FULL_42_16 TaxID=1798404 RepID=A0A1G1ZFK8_9BACT|nr:MAG: hypothetical protein A3B92_04090 [Candidatus Harrisonbacteria bacterium RIFCSPHIGHO2_02_FULL_42_16]OGY66713.1 MAG: hypothetical protein A3I89_01400 [Candidatus Harrisonbacteria bacterium RIFCSPLOWO2_02_FULL_41_11]